MTTTINPRDLHDPTPFGYAHTTAVPAGSDLVLVAGQYASGADGAVVSSDFAEQVGRVFANLGTALAAHGLQLEHVVQLRTYVVDLDGPKLGVIGQAVAQGCGRTLPSQTVIGVAGLAMPQILIEVEAVAARS